MAYMHVSVMLDHNEQRNTHLKNMGENGVSS